MPCDFSQKVGAPEDMKIILVCRVSKGNGGGVGGGKSISSGKKQHDFRDLAAAKKCGDTGKKTMGTLICLEIVLRFCSNCPNHRF